LRRGSSSLPVTFAVWPSERPSSAVVSINLMGCASWQRAWGIDYAWKTTGCDEVSIFLAGDRRTAPCTGAGGEAYPSSTHPGCRTSWYSHPACRPYRYSQASPVAATPPAASPCADVNIGRSRTHRAEEDTGSDKRLMSSVRAHGPFGATSPTCKLYYAVTASGLFALSWDGQLRRDPRIASEGLFGHARGATKKAAEQICGFIVVFGPT
jgi:hypothetical protein